MFYPNQLEIVFSRLFNFSFYKPIFVFIFYLMDICFLGTQIVMEIIIIVANKGIKRFSFLTFSILLDVKWLFCWDLLVFLCLLQELGRIGMHTIISATHIGHSLPHISPCCQRAGFLWAVSWYLPSYLSGSLVVSLWVLLFLGYVTKIKTVVFPLFFVISTNALENIKCFST